MIGLGIAAAVIYIVCIALARAAGMADRRLEEIQGLSAGREAGGLIGN